MPHSSKQNLIAYLKGYRNKDEYRHMRALRRATQAPQQGPATVTTTNTTAAITRAPEQPQRPIPIQAQQESRITKRKPYQKRATIAALLSRELSPDSEPKAADGFEPTSHNASNAASSASTNQQPLSQRCFCSPYCPGPHMHTTTTTQNPASFNHQTRSQPCPCSPYCPGPHMHDQRFGPVPGYQPYFDARPQSVAPSQLTLPPQNLAPLQPNPSNQAIGNVHTAPTAGGNINPVTGRPFGKPPTERMLKDARKLAAVNGVTSPDKRPGQPRLQPHFRPVNFDPDKLRPLLCPICGFGFVSRYHVQSHFHKCVELNGNPNGLRWDDGLPPGRG